MLVHFIELSEEYPIGHIGVFYIVFLLFFSFKFD